MNVAEHPSVVDLESFATGTLDGPALNTVEAHIAECPACQERASTRSSGPLVDLLRRAHVRGHDPETIAAEQTPAPSDAGSLTLPLASPVGPDELIRHERYRVVRLLGEGGMGSVYEAEHRAMQRTVALKVIRRAFTSGTAATERFRREVRAAAKLSHPNIVTAYDAETAGATHFLVMEYVKGVSLARLVKENGPLPVPQACGSIRQAALGLQHAHERGMIHRDVKPDNLIRTADGTVKVLDFGLAALTAERGLDGLSSQNAIMGTPEYMAPEQADDPGSADIRADVYSLGCTLYFLLTGQVPYPAQTALRKINAHREWPVPSVRALRPEVPPELDAVVARLLAKKPEDRYQTPGAAAAALAPFTTQQPPSRRRPPWKLLAAAALALAVLVAAGAVYRVQTDNGELVITTESEDVEVVIKQGGKVVRIIDTRTDKSVTLHSGEYELELKDAPGLKLDVEKATLSRGKTVLARIERLPKKRQASASDITILQRVAIPQKGTVVRTGITSDGKRFSAAIQESQVVIVWDGETGKEEFRVEGLAHGFTPDNRHLIVARGKSLRVHEAATGKLLRSLNTQWEVDGVSPLPLNDRVLGHCADGTMHLVDVNEGRILQSWRAPEGYFATTNDGKALFVKVRGEAGHVVWDPQANKRLDGYARLARYDRVGPFRPGDQQAYVTDGGHTYVANGADGKLDREAPRLPERHVAGSRALSYADLTLLGYADGILRLFSYATGREHAAFTLPGRERSMTDWTIWLSPDARHACVASDQSVYLLRLPVPAPDKDKP